MKKLFALSIVSLLAVSTASAECPSVEALKDMAVSLAVQEKQGEQFQKDSLPMILSCAEALQGSDYVVAPQIIEVASRLLEKEQGSY